MLNDVIITQLFKEKMMQAGLKGLDLKQFVIEVKAINGKSVELELQTRDRKNRVMTSQKVRNPIHVGETLTICDLGNFAHFSMR